MIYNVDLLISYPGYVEVEADSPEEALEKVKQGQFTDAEIPCVSFDEYTIKGINIYNDGGMWKGEKPLLTLINE